MVLLKGKKVKIRKANQQDAEILCRWWSDGRVMIHVGFPNGISQDVEKLRTVLSENNKDHCRYMILDKRNRLIGECIFKKIDSESYDIGLKICELDAQGKGYGYDALCTFIQFIFEKFHPKKIILDTLYENYRAQSLYKKVGFIIDEIRENAWIDPNGIGRKGVYMSLLRENFADNQNTFSK